MSLVACQIREHGEGPVSVVFSKIGREGCSSKVAGKEQIFSCKDTWEAIREKKPRVEWSRIIWYPLFIPKHAFFLWLTFKDRLTTGDKMLKGGVSGEFKFCQNYMETKDHLFFECGPSKRIWRAVMTKCMQKYVPTDWDSIDKV